MNHHYIAVCLYRLPLPNVRQPVCTYLTNMAWWDWWKPLKLHHHSWSQGAKLWSSTYETRKVSCNIAWCLLGRNNSLKVHLLFAFLKSYFEMLLICISASFIWSRCWWTVGLFVIFIEIQPPVTECRTVCSFRLHIIKALTYSPHKVTEAVSCSLLLLSLFS
jgi:hypothetical protein